MSFPLETSKLVFSHVCSFSSIPNEVKLRAVSVPENFHNHVLCHVSCGLYVLDYRYSSAEFVSCSNWVVVARPEEDSAAVG